jgi:Fe-S-cluster containining protein
MLMGDDENVPVELTIQDQWGGWVMRRLDDGWCAALDRHTMRCTIYQQRPIICRDYQAGESDCLVCRYCDRLKTAVPQNSAVSRDPLLDICPG